MSAVVLTFLTATASILAGPAPQPVDLAALQGWNVVVAENAIESEVYAAEEFQRLCQQASGIKLPITRKAVQPDRNVFIGPGKAMRTSPVAFDIDSFGREELRIIVRDRNIAIAGGRPRGTLYGVYTFVEDYLGVRFLTVDHTHVPPVGRKRSVGPIDRRYRPPMDYRWVAYEANYARPDFATRLRLNGLRIKTAPVDGKDWRDVGKYGGRTPMQLPNHSFNKLLPPAKYAKDHPEYYCLFKGKRWARGGRSRYGMQLCLTHPDVLRIVTKNVLDQFAARPDILNISVAPNDGGAHCQCPPCAAINEREGATMGTLLTFVNAVADEVAKKFPDRMVSTLAYAGTSEPPKTLRPRDNVQIMWCSISTCFIHGFNNPRCKTNRTQIRQLRTWSKRTKNLYTWNYYMNDERHTYQLPLPNLQLIRKNVRYQRSLGVNGIFMQASSSSHGNEWEELRNYMMGRLLWDPNLRWQRLMDEWLKLHYGPAAPPIRRWIRRLHKRSVASGKHCRCLGGAFADYGLDGSDARAGLAAFAEATRLAGDDKAVRDRVEKASLWAYRAAIEPIWHIKGRRNVSPALARRMRPLAKRFFELCEKYGATRTTEKSRNTIGKEERRLRRLIGSWNAP